MALFFGGYTLQCIMLKVTHNQAQMFSVTKWLQYTAHTSFSSRHCTDLEQSSAACHICSVTSSLLLSLQGMLL